MCCCHQLRCNIGSRANPFIQLQDAQSPLQVVDETDRLLKQAYHNWLPALLSATCSANLASGDVEFTDGLPPPSRLVKIVTSATLTHDPTKLQWLQLQAPRCVLIASTPNDVLLASKLLAVMGNLSGFGAMGTQTHSVVPEPPVAHSRWHNI